MRFQQEPSRVKTRGSTTKHSTTRCHDWIKDGGPIVHSSAAPEAPSCPSVAKPLVHARFAWRKGGRRGGLMQRPRDRSSLVLTPSVMASHQSQHDVRADTGRNRGVQGMANLAWLLMPGMQTQVANSKPPWRHGARSVAGPRTFHT